MHAHDCSYQLENRLRCMIQANAYIQSVQPLLGTITVIKDAGLIHAKNNYHDIPVAQLMA